MFSLENTLKQSRGAEEENVLISYKLLFRVLFVCQCVSVQTSMPKHEDFCWLIEEQIQTTNQSSMRSNAQSLANIRAKTHLHSHGFAVSENVHYTIQKIHIIKLYYFVIKTIKRITVLFLWTQWNWVNECWNSLDMTWIECHSVYGISWSEYGVFLIEYSWRRQKSHFVVAISAFNCQSTTDFHYTLDSDAIPSSDANLVSGSDLESDHESDSDHVLDTQSVLEFAAAHRDRDCVDSDPLPNGHQSEAVRPDVAHKCTALNVSISLPFPSISVPTACSVQRGNSNCFLTGTPKTIFAENN